MRKIVVASLSATLLFVAIPSSSNAALSGTKCTKAGTTKSVSNFKYTCVKQGSKLVWSKGVAIKPVVKATPTPTQSEAAKSEPKPAQSSTPTPTIKPEPANLPVLTFENLELNQEYITQIAWEKLTQSYKNNSNKSSKFEIYIGPTTKTYEVNLNEVLSSITKVIGNFPVPKLFRIIYYSRPDLQWGIDKSLALMGTVEYQKSIDIHGGPMVKCNNPNDCNDGDAYVTSDGTAYIALGFSNSPNNNDLLKYRSGEIEAAEIYHALQQNFYAINSSFKPSRGYLRATNEPPFWLNIAGEDLSMVMHTVPSGDIKEYKGLISGNLWWAKQEYPDFGLKTISEYMNISNLDNYWSDFRCCTDNGRTWKMANMIGIPLLNIMIALKGPSVFLTFHEGMAAGKTFTQVFKEEFGVDYEAIEPTLSRVIYAEFLQATK